ncbi:uncharacterized protein [Venturia canescens]|uniref:uncharacterized protein n=1 Tax=Venturia canescens TaxID=32260 RepID=UPI001C9CE887|nr:uncharacterized protein LOC122416274 [Venturia canescens]
MEHECKEGSSRSTRVGQPTTPTSPSLNLMEQLLLAKIERQSITDVYEDDKHVANNPLSGSKTLLLRTDSMDSQTSASTFSSVISGDSPTTTTANFYCKCDDCLLGIVDKHQLRPPSVGRKKPQTEKDYYRRGTTWKAGQLDSPLWSRTL